MRLVQARRRRRGGPPCKDLRPWTWRRDREHAEAGGERWRAGHTPDAKGGTMEREWREFADELGPAQVVLVRDPGVGLEGFVVVDNVAAGPAIGGVRMAPDVTVHEVARLARAMTFKNAAAGLRHGGGKAGIVADPATDPARKERLMRSFARAIAGLDHYIPGPDMGTDETCMAYVYDEIGRAVGLPPELGGIPLDEIGATGYGLAAAAVAAQELGVISLEGARMVVQGFGSVGRHAACFLAEHGAVLVAASDSRGAVARAGGLPLEELVALKRQGRSVAELPGGQGVSSEELIGLDCDIWIPAARPDVFDSGNASRVVASLILQGANIPATDEAEQIFHERGLVSVPDFIANAGGVICAAVEYAGGSAAQAFQLIEEKVQANTVEVLRRAKEEASTPRAAAEAVARSRVERASTFRRRF